MRKISVLFLALAMLLSATATAETIAFGDYGVSITLPEGWVYKESEITEEFMEAGVVYGIDAHSGDKAIAMWVEIRPFEEASRAAREITVTEFEGYVTDMREFFPDMSLFAIKGDPFIYYTETNDDGIYLTAYTWSSLQQFSFVFLAEELTDEVCAVIEQIMLSYTTK